MPPQPLFLCVQAINKPGCTQPHQEGISLWCSMTSVHICRGAKLSEKLVIIHGKLCFLGRWEMVSKWDWSGTWCEHSGCNSFTTKQILLLWQQWPLLSTVWGDWGGESAVPSLSIHNTSSSIRTSSIRPSSIRTSSARRVTSKGSCYSKGYFELEMGSNTQIFQSIFSLPITEPLFLSWCWSKFSHDKWPSVRGLLAGQRCTVPHFTGI